jgi:predicted ATPase/DNA-binding SARP family transcriptional activator/tetratricopeptide (TPR) repeat protein
MKSLRLYSLGGFRVTVDDRPITEFEADTARALLAYLALNTASLHRREYLAHLLWGEQPREHGLVNLRAALNRLRHALSDKDTDLPLVLAGRQDIQLNPQVAVWVDMQEIERLLAQVKHHSHRHLLGCPWCVAHLTHIADLYRGEFLSELSVDSSPFEEWQTARREEAHRLVVQVLATLAEHHHARGAYAEAERCTWRELALEPWNEEAHQQLMRTLFASGKRSAALAQYAACRARLREELGVEPSEETTALYHEICAAPRRKSAGAPVAFPRGGAPLTAHKARSLNNLPLPATPFFGREAELDLLLERLVTPINRLTTLVGEGGAGKTRLALAAAQTLLDSFAHGVWWVSLADLLPVADVWQTQNHLAAQIALALGLASSERTDAAAQLLDYVRDKELLLVLDNFEHLLVGAGLVRELLQVAPNLALLVTSRQPLNFRSEYALRLYGLPLPESGHDPQAYANSAVQLFAERANRNPDGFILTPGDLPAVLHVCHLVQGLPLGIELAAAWLGQESLGAILDNLRESLNLLHTAQYDVPDRHRSWRAVFEGSWALLNADERACLAALSVFQGGCTAQAAEAVTGAASATLLTLVDKSLLCYTEAGGRYELHEAVRQCAAEKLETRQERIAELHSAYYLTWIHNLEPALYGRHPLPAAAQMQADLGNIQLAWSRATSRANFGMLASSLPGLSRFYEMMGLRSNARFVLAQVVDKLLARPEPLSFQEEALLSQLLSEGAKTQLLLGDVSGAKTQAVQAVAHAQAHAKGPARAQAELVLGDVLQIEGLFEPALEHFQLALSEARRVQNFRLEVDSLSRLNFSLTRILAHTQQAWQKAQALGDAWLGAQVLNRLGISAANQGHFILAKQCFERVLSIPVWSADNHPRRASTIGNLGEAARLLGDYATAVEYHHQVLGILRERGDELGEMAVLGGLARAYRDLHDHARALSAAEASVQIGRKLGKRGDLILSYNVLGHILVEIGQLERAGAMYEQALDLASESGPQAFALESHAGLAELRRRQGQLPRALEHMGQILALLETEVPANIAGPMFIYARCYDVLHAAQDPRAQAVLEKAHGWLQERAGQIDDLKLRASFLEQVPDHRQIMQAYRSDVPDNYSL